MLADDQIIAKRAAKRVIVEYDELPATITIEDAIATQSYFLDERKIVQGNPSAVFSTCDHIIEGDIRTGAQEHFYLEANACIAIPKGENGEMELISSTQNLNTTQRVVAQCLGVPANRIICKVKRLGGGFGGKESRAVPIAAVVAVSASKVGIITCDISSSSPQHGMRILVLKQLDGISRRKRLLS